MKDQDVKDVFERESGRMITWLGTWVGTDKAIGQTNNAMAMTWLTASGGWITTHGPLQLLYSHGPTSKTLSAAAIGRPGPGGGMKNWVAPTLEDIKTLCRLYVGIGFACSMAQLGEDREPPILDLIRKLCGPMWPEPFPYSDLRIDGKTRGAIKAIRGGFEVLGPSAPSWGYAMGRLWRHEVDRTVLWIEEVDRCARSV